MTFDKILFYREKQVIGRRIKIGVFEDFIPFDDEIENNVNIAFEEYISEAEWINYIINMFDNICILHEKFQRHHISYCEIIRAFKIREISFERDNRWAPLKTEEREFCYNIDNFTNMWSMRHHFLNLTTEVFKRQGKERSRDDMPTTFYKLGITLNEVFHYELKPVTSPVNLPD